jgi:sulfur carrier protein
VIASHITVTEEQIEVITVFINGAPRQLPDHSSIAALIDELGYTGKRIALERNGDIVPRSQYAEKPLAEGDRLEIVVAVGGG